MSGYDLKGMFTKATNQDRVYEKNERKKLAENLTHAMLDNSGMDNSAVEFQKHRKQMTEYSAK
jgi:hypothetical protein